MAWTTINATQTDADSPVNQTLMDAIRTNLDDLNVRVVGVSTEMFVKGWICFDGTGTISIKDSYNVTSIVDDAVGKYTVNWNTDFANANYAVVISNGKGALGNVGQQGYDAKVAGSVQLILEDSSGTNRDVENISAVAIGDQ